MHLYQKMVKSISLLLVCCLFAVLVPGGTAWAETPSSGSQTETGILKVLGSGSVLLNGNIAVDGATVLSDSQIQTQNGSQATVNFVRLGKLEIGCNSSVKITFTNDSVAADVLTGFAQLTANKGVNGTLMMNDGKVVKTDPASRSTVQTATANPCGTIVPAAGAGAGLSGGEIAGIVLGIGVGTGIVIWLATRDPSSAR